MTRLILKKSQGLTTLLQLQNDNDLFKTIRLQLINSMSKYGDDYHDREQSFHEKLLYSFDNASQSITVDKGQFFQDEVDHFSNFVDESKDNFTRTIENINVIDGINLNNYNNAITQIQSAIVQSLADQSIQDSSNISSLSYIYNFALNYSNYPEFVEDKYYDDYIPTIEKNGSNWGFFGLMSGYLIRTQSSDLVILMGMFGFGLLGASLFSFSNSGTSKNFIESFKTEPLIPNFGNVLARGFGAALVVYLAAKGGLAIFSAGTSTDANGYILLLSCFVGAVFSEKVWNKIRDSFYGQNAIGIDDNKDKEAKADNLPNNNLQSDQLDEATLLQMTSAQNMQQLKMHEATESNQNNTA